MNYHKTRKDKADGDFKRKITGMETDESHFRRLTSKYMSNFVTTHPEGNQVAPVTANKIDSLSNEYQGSLKGRFTHSMPYPCRSPVMPCR